MGFFTVTVGSQSGSYSWRVKSAQPNPTPAANNPGWLASSGSLTLAGGGGTTQAEMGLQRAGDADNSNIVDAVDFIVLRNTFGKSSGQVGYDGRADFSGDGMVSVYDFPWLKV